MENWDIEEEEDADSTDPTLEDYMTSVMESAYYFEGIPFGETILRQAEDFSINACYAEEDTPDGMYPVTAGEGIVVLEATLADHNFYMEFVFKEDDEYGIFYLCYGELDEEPYDDFKAFIATLEPFFE